MDASTSRLTNNDLRQERIQRNWRQKDVADQVGTTVVTVRRWEQGSHQPSAYFRVKLCALFGKSAQELGLIPEETQLLPFESNPASIPHDPQLPMEIGASSDQLAKERAFAYFQKPSDLDWQRMLQRLRRSYRELLTQSLHSMSWHEPGLSSQPDLVSNVTNLLFSLPDRGERLLAPGTGVLDAFDEAEGELLILGAPGAGKSMLLLDLAQHLVDQALTNELDLLPVILPLSSWALERLALTTWMMEQLSRIYDVPRHLSERWFEQGRLLPLLDGLDEMEEEARPACIAAINRYHRSQLTPLVVCSRQAEYEAAARGERLALQNALIVQPLSNKQIEASLCAVSSPFAGEQSALQKQKALWELVSTPLMLSVLLQTYRNVTMHTIIQQEGDLERQVWTDYVARQVYEKGNQARYPLKHTHRWLSWLAQQMRAHQQTIFYAEHLDMSWLASPQQYLLARLTLQVPSIVIGLCVGFLISIFLIGNSMEVFLLQLTAIGGFIGGCLSPSRVKRPARHFRNALLLGVLVAASSGFNLHTASYGVSDWLRDGGILGLGSLVSGWAFQALIAHFPKSQISVAHKRFDLRTRLLRWANTVESLHIWRAGALLAIGIGLSEGVSLGLDLVRFTGLSEAIGSALAFGLYFTVGISATLILIHSILKASLGTLRFAERIQWTWRSLFQPGHLRKTIMVITLTFLLSGSLNGMGAALLSYRLSDLLLVILFLGLSGGVSFGLMYWLVLGLYQGLKQEHLEERDRSQFNQGIRHSLRNGLLVCLISGTIIAVTGGLSVGLRVGVDVGMLSGQVPGQPSALNIGISFGLSAGLSMLVAAMVIMWALSGGFTILRHYVVRWVLARHRIFPWQASAFLDDATNRNLMRRVGGGYSFIHRRLQDYFVDIQQPPPRE